MIKKFPQNEIIIFGAGVDGTRLYKEIFFKLKVICFIDNGETKNHTVFGKKLYAPDYLKDDYHGEIIIVSSQKYKMEMIKQLLDYGFKLGKEIWIWNGKHDIINGFDFSDDNTKKFIALNKELWAKKMRFGAENKILIPYVYTPEITYVPLSYGANYLAEKYDAKIYGIVGTHTLWDNNLWEVYKSINVCGYIEETLDSEMNFEVDKILREICDQIHTKEDLKDIFIYGENFGIDIIRNYLRCEFPQLYLNDYNFKIYLKKMIGYVVFWHHYMQENHNNVKAVIVWDGLYYHEGILRKIAYGYDIPVYSIVNSTCFKWEYDMKFSFDFYKKFYYMLNEEEQQKGIAWAKHRIEYRFNGDVKDMMMVHKSTFDAHIKNFSLPDNNKIKVMICPHYMEDDAYPYGDMLFFDQWDWLNYLGKLSNSTKYDWYLKPHPIEKESGDALVNEYLQKYPNIKLLPKYISPQQLQEAGMQYALTIHGSIGFEYPLFGINVINAGFNPHIAFDFDINPKNLREYTEILNNLESVKKDIKDEEIYQFYCIHFGYYRAKKRDMRKIFFDDQRLQDMRGLVGSETEYSTELFRYYIEEMGKKYKEKHEDKERLFERLFSEMDAYKEGVFYKQELLYK